MKALAKFVMVLLTFDMMVVHSWIRVSNTGDFNNSVATVLSLANQVVLEVFPVTVAHFNSIYLHVTMALV